MGWLSSPNWIGALILSLLLKLPPRKLEPWFGLWYFFLLSLLCISINLLYNHACITVVMSGLVLLGATWNCHISWKMHMQNCWSFICCLSWTLGSFLKCSQLKEIVRWAEPSKCDILLVSRILWHKIITTSLKEWRFSYLILIGNFQP